MVCVSGSSLAGSSKFYFCFRSIADVVGPALGSTPVANDPVTEALSERLELLLVADVVDANFVARIILDRFIASYVGRYRE